MNINFGQVLSILLVVLGVFVASAAQLNDLFGAGPAHYIVSASGLLMSILAGVQGITSGQGSQLRAVQAMSGVDKIVVSGGANQTLAQMAVDPNSKVESTPASMRAVQQTARGA